MKTIDDDGNERIVSSPRFLPPGPFPLKENYHRWILEGQVTEEVRPEGRWWFYFWYNHKTRGPIAYWYLIGDDPDIADFYNLRWNIWGGPRFGQPQNGYLFEFMIRDSLSWHVESQ